MSGFVDGSKLDEVPNIRNSSGEYGSVVSQVRSISGPDTSRSAGLKASKAMAGQANSRQGAEA